MKTIKLNLIKSGRVWIKCETDSGYNCKLKLNEFSKNLEMGEHELLVNDLSVRSKYGTDLKYELVGEKKEGGKISLQHETYNYLLHEECKNLGGQWDNETKTWFFDEIVEDKIEDLEDIFCSETVNVQIKSLDEVSSHTSSVDFCGYNIAIAKGRDTGAYLGEKISKLSGSIDSGGSFKNWYTHVSKDTIFRLKVPKNLLNKYLSSESEIWEIEILNKGSTKC